MPTRQKERLDEEPDGMQPPSLIVTPELKCDKGCPLPRLVQFMFRSFPPKYRVLLQSPFIMVRSVDVLPHTKHNEPHQRNSVRVTDPSGVCMYSCTTGLEQ